MLSTIPRCACPIYSRRSIADRSMIDPALSPHCIVTHAASELGVSVSHRHEGRASTCRARSRMSRVARRRGSNALSELGPRQRAASARAPLRAAAIGGGAPGDGDERLTQSRAGPRRIEPHARRATRAQVTCSVHSDAHRAPSSSCGLHSIETQAVDLRGGSKSGRQNLQMRRLDRACAMTRARAAR